VCDLLHAAARYNAGKSQCTCSKGVAKGPRAGQGVRNHVGLKRIKLDRGRVRGIRGMLNVLDLRKEGLNYGSFKVNT